MPFMTIVEMLAIVIFRNIIFRKKITDSFDVMVPISIVMYFLNKYVLTEIPSMAFIVVIITITTALAIRNKIKMWIVITEVVLGFLIMGVCENIALMLSISIEQYVSIDSVYLNIICILICFLLGIIVMKNIPDRYYIDLNRSIYKNNTFILLVINLLLVMIIGKLLFDNEALVGINGLQILVGFVLLFLLTFLTYLSVINEIKERDRLVTENSFKPILEDYVKQLRANEHEYKNHLNAIYAMIMVEDGDDIKEKVEEYIGSIKQSDNLNKILYVDNVILKAVLYSKLKEAEDKGIKCDYNILSSLDNIKINSTELVVVISNLLNNALEAAQNSKKPWVRINIFEENNKETHVVQVENSVENINNIDISSIMNKGYTTKGEGRGFGLDNINKIMKRVNGQILIEPKEESLSIELKF